MQPVETPESFPFWTAELNDGTERLRLGIAESFLEEHGPGGREPEIVGLELVAVGTRLHRGDALGFVHLPDRVVDLRAPFDLVVARRNEAAIADPRLVRTSPYLRGWLKEIERG